MKIPSEVKPASWGLIGGAIALAIIGFTWGGWRTASGAEQMASERSTKAVVAALAPICVQNFNQQSAVSEKLAEFKKVSSWQRDDYITKGGWAITPGEASPRSGVAKACADALAAAST